MYRSNALNTQNALLLSNLMEFYNKHGNLEKMMKIINGESEISLRIVDWFVTNFAKKYYTVYELSQSMGENHSNTRFKVYNDYKLKLKAYSKKRFDPFCRWDRISIPYNENQLMETTIGQLNFFKWAIENKIVDYIKNNYETIETDMNKRNVTTKKRATLDNTTNDKMETTNSKTRKRREELSVSACKTIKKEDVKIVVKFN
jgi:hypothetical protein|tara:strand:+ start:1643 stop:2248 length:606 start_codon:yes stop_codon:yes gene_type:complete